jgi:hypothetical protein
VKPLGGGSSQKDAGVSDAGSVVNKTDAQDDSPGLQSALCGKDPQTGVELCLAISTCPDEVIDPDLFPGCGYKVKGQSYDLVCLCNGLYLCPVGVPQTCLDIPKLFSEQTVFSICAQVNEGRCVQAQATKGQ